MSDAPERHPNPKTHLNLTRCVIAAIAIVMIGFLLLLALGTHAEFLQSAGLVPLGANNWFSSLDTAVKNADGEMTLAAVATSPIAAGIIGWSHYSGGQQSHKYAGRIVAGLVVLVAVAPHVAS